MMKFFKKNYSVCSECGVHFEPVTGYESRWGNLCSTHRKPVMERDKKKDAVVAWASANWERLSKMMDEEKAIQESEYKKALQNNFAAQQQSFLQRAAGPTPPGFVGAQGIFS